MQVEIYISSEAESQKFLLGWLHCLTCTSGSAMTNSTVSLNGQFTCMKLKTVHYLLLGKELSYFCVAPFTVILTPLNAVPYLAWNLVWSRWQLLKKTQFYNNAVSGVALILEYCTLRMKTRNSVNFFFICKAWTMPTLFFTRACAMNTFSHGKSVFTSYLLVKWIFNHMI